MRTPIKYLLSTFSFIFLVTVNANAAPSSPTLAASVSGSTATLSWSAVSGATGYKLYYGTSSGAYTGSVDLGDTTSKTYNNLGSGTYYLALTAYDSSASSPYSSEVAITVLTAPTLAVSLSGSNMALSWNAVTGATGYTLYYAPYPAATPIASKDMGSQTSYSTSLTAGTAYYIAIKATNSSGSSGYSNICNFTIIQNSTSSVTDIEGNVYNAVAIGAQTWMQENLKVTKYSNGDSISTTTAAIKPETSPKYQWAYNGDASLVATYGRLYTWHAATDNRGVCPSNWHVPSDAEWTTLTNYLGGVSVAGGKMKEAGTTHWYTPNTSAGNSSYFTALPGGVTSGDGTFSSMGYFGFWWSATEYDTANAWIRILYYNYVDVYRGVDAKVGGMSVRCVRD